MWMAGERRRGSSGGRSLKWLWRYESKAIRQAKTERMTKPMLLQN